MLTVTPDINVLVSALIGRRDRPSPPTRLLEAWKQHQLIFALSTPMLNKINDVLYRPSLLPFLVARYSPENVDTQIQTFLRALRRRSRISPGILDIQVIKDDPEDDSIIIAAVEGKADCIVSGDHHLTSLGSYKNIPILIPSDFITRYTIA